MSGIVSYGGVQTPSFVIVEKINFSVLPQRKINSIDIPQKAGAYFFNVKEDVKVFSVTFALKADSSDKVMAQTIEFAKWLDYDEPQPLIFEDMPHITYYAIVENAIDIDKFARIGKGTINFLCLDPAGYFPEKTQDFSPHEDHKEVAVLNAGVKKIYPRFEFTFKEQSTEFHIISADRTMSFGKQQEFGNEVIDPMPYVLRDDMGNVSYWQPSTSVHDGEVTGNFWTNGYSFLVSDFGEGEKWHGAAAQRALPRTLENYRVTMNLALVPQSMGDLGRVLMTLLDANNNRIATISIRNGTIGGIRPFMEAFVGYTAVISGGGTYGPTLDYMHPFYGDMFIEKRGDQWWFRWQQFDPYTREAGRYWEEFFVYPNKEGVPYNRLAAVQISIMRAGEYPVIPVGYMYIGDVAVQEIIEVQENEDPYIFKPEDRLIVDSETGEVTLNGLPFYHELDPASRFIILNKGQNLLTTYPLGIADGIIKYKERV